MYGTVSRFMLKPGMEMQLAALTQEFDQAKVPGALGEYVYRMDSNPNEYYLVVIFESEEAYKRNAASPEQDARYQKIRALLVSDPEWHDGAIVYSSMASMAK
jgi:quinol monooxygenase YgiN